MEVRTVPGPTEKILIPWDFTSAAKVSVAETNAALLVAYDSAGILHDRTLRRLSPGHQSDSPLDANR